MHRTIGDSYGLSGSKRIFRQENSPSWQATQVTYDTMNCLQEEIANVVEAEGFSLNTSAETIAAMTQLNTAIDKKVSDEATARDAAIEARVPTATSYISASGINFYTDVGALSGVSAFRGEFQRIETPKIVLATVGFWFPANVADYKWVAMELPESWMRPWALYPSGNGVAPATCILWDDSATPPQVAVQDIYSTLQRGNIDSADRNVLMWGNAELMSQNPNDFPSTVSFPQTDTNDKYALHAFHMYRRY